jgi:hypothetical protein
MVDSDIDRQQGIQLLAESVGIYVIVGIEMGYHPTGMNTSVGTSCTEGRDVFGTKAHLQSFVELLLHTCAVGLHLPSVVGTAVERQIYEISFLHLPFVVLRGKGTAFFASQLKLRVIIRAFYSFLESTSSSLKTT